MAADPKDFSSMNAAELAALLERFRSDKASMGRVFAELHERFGWTWREIGPKAGVHLATAHRWAQPYLRKNTE